jgi:uncharacterized membrane protein YjgN (DUF898 family)
VQEGIQAALPAAAAAAPPPTRAEFLGSGAEYFRIWIVNLALILATLGIYSPWAKVRREQYFHRNLRLAGAGFDFDARPVAILRGRILALALLGLVNLAGQSSPWASGLASALFVLALPWMITAALRFRLAHTLHRGLRFAFHGRTAEAARAYLLWPLAAALSLGFLFPVAVQRQQRFLYGHSAFGGTRFASDLRVGEVYAICLGMLAIPVGTAIAAGAAHCALPPLWMQPADAPGASLAVGVATLLAALVAAGAYFRVRLHNLVWGRLRLGPHRFRSHQTLASYLALELGNLAATVATLGLFRPWAAVRSARWRAERLELVPAGSLDEFFAGAARSEGAAADEIAELFGFDIGF